jgi:Flp pilus assembly protein CpaB
MSRCANAYLSRRIAGLLSGLLFAILAIPLVAQPATEVHPGLGIGPVYDAAHEVTLNGIIQTVVTKHTKGSPAGMHLLVVGPEGVVDAHVGPFLNKQAKEALHEGTPIRIVGAKTSIRGKSYLLARQLTVDGRTITVRTNHGFLAPGVSQHRVHSTNERKSAVEVKGGAQ